MRAVSAHPGVLLSDYGAMAFKLPPKPSHIITRGSTRVSGAEVALNTFVKNLD